MNLPAVTGRRVVDQTSAPGAEVAWQAAIQGNLAPDLAVKALTRDRPLAGDWVYRPGASVEQKLNDLARVLREETNWPVRFEKRSGERLVYVACGRLTRARDW